MSTYVHSAHGVAFGKVFSDLPWDEPYFMGELLLPSVDLCHAIITLQVNPVSLFVRPLQVLPDKSLEICLIGLQPFIGLAQVVMSLGRVVLLTKMKAEDRRY